MIPVITRILILLLAVSVIIVSAQGPSEPRFDTEVSPRPKEICIVCNRLIGFHDRVYLLEGQRVAVHPEHCDGMLRDDPWVYIARLKPRGGLFGGEVAPGGGISNAWLFLGMYVILGLAFSAVCAHRALNTGQAAIPWFFAGLFLNAIGYLALLLRPANEQASAAPKYAGVVKIPVTADPQPCPHCNEWNHPSATKCLCCGANLTPTAILGGKQTQGRIRLKKAIVLC